MRFLFLVLNLIIKTKKAENISTTWQVDYHLFLSSRRSTILVASATDRLSIFILVLLITTVIEINLRFSKCNDLGFEEMEVFHYIGQSGGRVCLGFAYGKQNLAAYEEEKLLCCVVYEWFSVVRLIGF